MYSLRDFSMADVPSTTYQKAPKFTELNDLASEKVGSKVCFATDDWFAVAENLLKAEDPVFQAGVFTEFGKWMDGWETRRKRVPGHDWCIIQLGVAGVIDGVDVDTSYFTGNYTPKISIQAACLSTGLPDRISDMGTDASLQEITDIAALRSQNWTEILGMEPLKPGYKTSCHNYFPVKSSKRWTHIRLNMFPDGGIARFRVYGCAVPDWSLLPSHKLLDLVAMENGGRCVGYSDAHFGHARNLIQPGRAGTMAEGWETARKPDRPAVLSSNNNGLLQVPGYDWCIFRLGQPGHAVKIEIDTNHFKGNFPDSCQIEGCNIPLAKEDSIASDKSIQWRTLLPAKKLSAHKQFYYESSDINDCGVISHVRLTIAPDGGISRMRLWGYRKDKSSSKL